ncbi:hypothetical protein EJ06DRAFT_534344 [Trichodelitschia bisporula]|uniref:Mitochondrial F1F0 ATP synthase subunit Atp14 n=1 Tax=Trichodelitschia bisporula TaxID=703511 RepID=A0A6G1HKA8_9PEZI|nr:hypothetical protein EJ06DRAFT_534344 [Trichodelitschia bisporula]
MISQSIRASRPLLARMARQAAITSQRTLFTPSAVRSADLVQELYLRELKNYKSPVVKASDAEGNVQTFSIPKPPRSPEETDIAKELSAYESQAVELEGQVAASEGGKPVEEDWFEEEPEEDEAKAHH